MFGEYRGFVAETVAPGTIPLPVDLGIRGLPTTKFIKTYINISIFFSSSFRNNWHKLRKFVIVNRAFFYHLHTCHFFRPVMQAKSRKIRHNHW